MKKKLACILIIAILLGVTADNKMGVYAAGMTYEYEENDSFVTANNINLGESITGTIGTSGDADYYMVSPTADGNIEIDFCHTYDDSFSSWELTVYIYADGQYTELSSKKIKLNDNEKISLPDVGVVKNGIYYIRVYSTGEKIVGINYIIQTSFKASNYFEKEVNNSYASATNVSLKHSFGGTINDLSDVDYYKIVAPEVGMLDLTFKYAYESNYYIWDGWDITIYKYSDGAYTEWSNTYVKLNESKSIELPSIWTQKNGVYYVKISGIGVVGKNYTLKPSFNMWAPYNYSVKVSKSTAKLTWQSDYNEGGYEIYYKVGKKGKYRKLASTTKNSYSFKNMKKGKTYYFKVRMYEKVGKKTYYSFFTSSKSAKRK